MLGISVNSGSQSYQFIAKLKFVIRFIRRKILKKIQGKYRFQSFFTKLYYVALAGMNVGPAGNIKEGGEVPVLQYVKRIISQDFPNDKVIIFDVGANQGDYSHEVIDVFKQDVSILVYAFEPSPSVFTLLQDNLNRHINIKLFNFGFSNEIEERFLYTDLRSSDCASLYMQDLSKYGLNAQPEETVKLTTLDKFCSEEGISRIHLLKMDVEGHELKVLEGAKNLLDSDSPPVFIQFEFGTPNVVSRTYLKDFFELLSPKYKISRIVRDGLWYIPSYTEALELFGTTNYLAELK